MRQGYPPYPAKSQSPMNQLRAWLGEVPGQHPVLSVASTGATPKVGSRTYHVPSPLSGPALLDIEVWCRHVADTHIPLSPLGAQVRAPRWVHLD
jgi:hypothetical protein